ncbi:MAG: SRPBCC family protein [Pseudomonadota bacterium]
MPFAFRPLLAAAASLSLISCASNPTPPTAPPELTSPPALSDGWHATFHTIKVIDAPLIPLQQWIVASNELVLAMEETEQIKKPVDVRVVSGTWPEKGSVRWVKLSDGHYTYERVLENRLPEHFSYQIWGLTSGASDHITYAKGQWDWREVENDKSEFTWTYSLRPNSFIKRPFVSSFLDSDMKPFMEGAIGRMATKAEGEFAGWREGEAE